MGKVFGAIFVIFGTVVGSGFASGKEIFVFFSRFGALSYLNIFLACVMFFFVFKFFLSSGDRLSKRFTNTKWITFVTGFVSTIFCASMLSGLSNLFSYFPDFLRYVLMIVVVIMCFFVAQKGISWLEKINLSLMPVVAIAFFVVLLSFLPDSGTFSGISNVAGVLFVPLYVVLNTSMNTLVLCELGREMTKKQINWTCLLSSLLIFVFLMLGNSALSSVSSVSEMPFLTLSQTNKVAFWTMFFIILLGCFTTLISLCYTLNRAIGCVVKNEKISAFLSVILPLAISLLGFSQIVTFLYPVCSVFGVFVMIFLMTKRE